MILIVAGGRDFLDYNHLKRTLDHMLSKTNKNEITIIHGGANGADKLGEKYAKESNIPFRVYPADWDKYGKKAGYKRNAEMGSYATHLISFWDGKSKGTKHMIDIAKKKNLTVHVEHY